MGRIARRIGVALAAFWLVLGSATGVAHAGAAVGGVSTYPLANLTVPSGQTNAVDIPITGPAATPPVPANLASTGTGDLMPIIVAGVALILAGLALILALRRSRPR